MSIEKSPKCAFEEEGAYCEISQTGQRCYQFRVCFEANKRKGDITPAEWGRLNPSWTMQEVLIMLTDHLTKNPDSKTPLRSCHERFSDLPQPYVDEIRQGIKKRIK